MYLELKPIRIRRKQQVKLNKENRKAFDSIKQYMETSFLVSFEREEILQQVLDSMLQAQSEGKDINLFLGCNHREFCDSIIMEYSTTKSRVLGIISLIEDVIIYTILGMFFGMLFYKAPVFNLNSIITTTGLLLIVYPMSRKSRREKIYPKNNFLPEVNQFPRGLVSFILYLVYGLILAAIFSSIGKSQGVNLSTAQISIFSAKPFFIIGILFVLASEIYKSICSKQRKI
ncbi:hypothetical protein NBE98_10800 [Clostridium swellfunianum]|uniref:hypothetical protein n=1 Tax=Clostridium swellfunianum TaxID=1367462 RepID=UPI00202E5D40|nr:hypothetical protein [Clostridium swellfunianum]MCM0648864.1 hypothetical protein [Clostridium swellfunianum]